MLGFSSDWYFQLLHRQACVLLNQINLLQVMHQSLETSQREMEDHHYCSRITAKTPLIYYSETSCFCATGMAGSCRHQSGAAPIPEGAGAAEFLSEDRAQSWGGRWVHAGGSPLPSGVFPVWRRSSGRSGETEAGLLFLPALWTRLQRGRDCLLLQVRVPQVSSQRTVLIGHLYVEITDLLPLSLQGLCNRPHLCHVHGLFPRQCS